MRKILVTNSNLKLQAISDKIKSLDFQDCKVRVLNVDSQASFSNIVVQVIGEMSNKSEPHHKFVQTFVLAEQPNGYFVLNDIFRYLSDDEDEIVEDEQPQPEIPAEKAPTPAEGVTEAQPNTDDQVVTESAAVEVDEKLEEEQAEEVQDEVADTNGDVEPTAEDPLETEERAATEDILGTEAAEHVESEEHADSEANAAPAEPAPEAAAPTPAPEAPPAKKTWASMLGGGVQKPAVPALPIATPAQPKPTRPAQAPQVPQPAQPAQPAQAPKASTEAAPTSTPPSASTPTSQSNGWQMADHSKKSNRPQNRVVSDGTTLAYIKNVNEKVDARILREVLEQFGDLKYYDVSRPRVSYLPTCLSYAY